VRESLRDDPRLALVGSGEFLPVTAEVDQLLLSGRAMRVAVVPTAAAQDGADRVQYWLDLADGHYRTLGCEAVPVPALDRAAADDVKLADRIAGCGLVYLSGGNPGYLAATLRGTRVWAAIVDAVRSGAALAGCSAGAMAMSALAPHVRDDIRQFDDGLGVLDHVAVIPHFDKIQGWIPGIVEQYVARLPKGATLVGIDEDTALVGGPHRWTVMGRQQVHVFASDGTTVVHAAGAQIRVDW